MKWVVAASVVVAQAVMAESPVVTQAEMEGYLLFFGILGVAAGLIGLAVFKAHKTEG